MFSVEPNQAFVRKPVEPIREANPWGDATNTNIVKSQTEPTFAAFQSVKQHQPAMTSSQSFVQKTRGDAWMESITQEMTALKTGESIASTVSSIGTTTAGRTAPAIPKRTGIAALPHFNRSQTQYQSMRSPQNNTTIQFTRSHSVRYVSVTQLRNHNFWYKNFFNETILIYYFSPDHPDYHQHQARQIHSKKRLSLLVIQWRFIISGTKSLSGPHNVRCFFTSPDWSRLKSSKNRH